MAHGYSKYKSGRGGSLFLRKRAADYKDIFDRWADDSFEPMLASRSSIPVGEAYAKYKGKNQLALAVECSASSGSRSGSQREGMSGIRMATVLETFGRNERTHYPR